MGLGFAAWLCAFSRVLGAPEVTGRGCRYAPRTTFPSGLRGAARKLTVRPLSGLRFPAPSALPPFPSGPRGVDGVKMAAGSGGPAARELFAEGLLQFLRPAVRQLDGHVHAVRSGNLERGPGRLRVNGGSGAEGG